MRARGVLAVLLVAGLAVSVFGPSGPAFLIADRAARVVVMALAGAALGVSGGLLQATLRNPLADPGILGINGGAGLAVLLGLCAYPDRRVLPPLLLPAAAFAGALLASAAVAALSTTREGRSPARMTVVGLAVAALGSAASMAIAGSLNDSLLRQVLAWQLGQYAPVSTAAGAALLGCLAGGIGMAWALSDRLEILRLGDEAAVGLGVPVRTVHAWASFAAALLAAGAVSAVGNLGFVGLAAPHLTGRGGPRARLVACAAAGALLATTADQAGRFLAPPFEIPAGVLSAILGGLALLAVFFRTSTP